ncbi:MAG: HNH endonuclease [Prochloraceae cyanobacterium]
MKCELCCREMDNLTVHHLIPRQYSKRKKLDIGPTINICSACHKQIHALFDNKQLAKELNTLAKLQQDPKIQKFLSWIKKQNPNKKVVVRRPK